MIPALWLTARVIGRSLTPWGALVAFGTDLVVALEAVAWNGVVMEITRLTVQRPRPFVFTEPAHYGREPAHYTSFYSGHTSFAAATTTSLVVALASRGAPTFLVAAAGVGAVIATALTGILRVAAGRHYPTDVLAGALAGFVIALTIAYLHRKPGAA